MSQRRNDVNASRSHSSSRYVSTAARPPHHPSVAEILSKKKRLATSFVRPSAAFQYFADIPLHPRYPSASSLSAPYRPLKGEEGKERDGSTRVQNDEVTVTSCRCGKLNTGPKWTRALARWGVGSAGGCIGRRGVPSRTTHHHHHSVSRKRKAFVSFLSWIFLEGER